MDSPDKSKKLFKCLDKVASFKSSLPRRVDPAEFSPKAKTPFSVLTYREGLLHRVTELADNAAELYRTPAKAISAIILTRAAQETFALLYVLNSKMETVISTEKLGDFHMYLMTNTFGYRIESDDDLPVMPNILGAIDKVDKVMDGSFRKSYESLSEYCHPNCAGVHSAYVKIDKENIWADIGSTFTEESVETKIGVLLGTLELFEHYYNEVSSKMSEFIKICESELESKT